MASAELETQGPPRSRTLIYLREGHFIQALRLKRYIRTSSAVGFRIAINITTDAELRLYQMMEYCIRCPPGSST